MYAGEKNSVSQKPVTVRTLQEMKRRTEKIACLTCYDASFAVLLDAAGVDVILVGDSLGMVIQGHSSTLPVTLSDMLYHCSLVARATHRAFLMVDMPFMSYSNSSQAIDNAARLLAEGGAQMVKLEGGGHIVDIVADLSRRQIPVCGHLGLTPQSVHKLGGYRIQGREQEAADLILKEALQLEQAGAEALVLECVPATLATKISDRLTIPVIGIGAGRGCDGQVLVLYDMLNVTPGKKPKFSENFMRGSRDISDAVGAFVTEVKSQEFPQQKHEFK